MRNVIAVDVEIRSVAGHPMGARFLRYMGDGLDGFLLLPYAREDFTAGSGRKVKEDISRVYLNRKCGSGFIHIDPNTLKSRSGNFKVLNYILTGVSQSDSSWRDVSALDRAVMEQTFRSLLIGLTKAESEEGAATAADMWLNATPLAEEVRYYDDLTCTGLNSTFASFTEDRVEVGTEHHAAGVLWAVCRVATQNGLSVRIHADAVKAAFMEWNRMEPSDQVSRESVIGLIEAAASIANGTLMEGVPTRDVTYRKSFGASRVPNARRGAA